MNEKSKCVIVTGRPGSGKTTLAKKLGETLWMPVISRDEIKEGYVNTFGIKHDQLSPDTNGIVTDLFFEIVNRYLGGHVSVIIEAAFQHDVWASRIPKIVEFASPVIILCSTPRTRTPALVYPKFLFFVGSPFFTVSTCASLQKPDLRISLGLLTCRLRRVL